MRSINMIIRRVQAGLPITDEELDFANEYVDKIIARNKKIEAGTLAIVGALLVLSGVAWLVFN